MKIDLKILDTKLYSKDRLPEYATVGSAGLDLKSTVDLVLEPEASYLMPTGLAMHIKKPGICGIILPRSGLGHKHGVVLGNLVGLIDTDYTGEIMLSIWNRTNHTNYISRGDKIAQIMFISFIQAEFITVDSLGGTDRGTGGFGSSGL